MRWLSTLYFRQPHTHTPIWRGSCLPGSENALVTLLTVKETKGLWRPSSLISAPATPTPTPALWLKFISTTDKEQLTGNPRQFSLLDLDVGGKVVSTLQTEAGTEATALLRLEFLCKAGLLPPTTWLPSRVGLTSLWQTRAAQGGKYAESQVKTSHLCATSAVLGVTEQTCAEMCDHKVYGQSWVFIGRTDVEAETPILWPPDVEWTHVKRP